MGKKVYNTSKRTNYKGSIPGMRKGGSLPKARRGLSKAQWNIPAAPMGPHEDIDPDIYTLGTDTLGNPIEGPKQIGSTKNVEQTGNIKKTKKRVTEQDLINEIEDDKIKLDELYNKEDSLWNVRHNVEDSLIRDKHIKNTLWDQKEIMSDVSEYNDFNQLYIDCMRGNDSACKQIKLYDEHYDKQDHIDYLERRRNEDIEENQKKTEESQGITSDDGNNVTVIPGTIDAETELTAPLYVRKRGGVVKKKRGGTILGGKYKKKRGGSVGRNGIL